MTKPALATLWSVAILAACLVPGSQIHPPAFLPFTMDKWVHLGMFLGFGALWLHARPERTREVLAAGVAYGIGIEILQGLLPIERSADPLDAAADVVGLLIGVGLVVAVRRWRASNG